MPCNSRPVPVDLKGVLRSVLRGQTDARLRHAAYFSSRQLIKKRGLPYAGSPHVNQLLLATPSRVLFGLVATPCALPICLAALHCPNGDGGVLARLKGNVNGSAACQH